jgi:phytoene synthase
MRGSATAIGNMMLPVMGFSGERETVKAQARALAEAFQMTNFLRDISEDYHDLGRIYLPQNLMQKYGVTEEDIKKKRFTPGMKRLIHELSVWTRNRYHEGVSGIKHLSKDCRLAVLLASMLYIRVLEKIESNDYNPFGKRARVGTIEKTHLVASTIVKYRTLKQSELKICKLTHH